jgi:F-type H+-transporting ATPase subunit epsilon
MAEHSFFNVLVLTLDRVIYEGKARSLILPGEKGVFEVLPYHKRLLTRLTRGSMILDGNTFSIQQGVAKVGLNEVTVIIEESRVG